MWHPSVARHDARGGDHLDFVGFGVSFVTSYLVGARWRFWNVSWPLVCLEVTSDHLQVGPSMKDLRGLVPRDSIAWPDVQRVELVRSPLPGRHSAGVRLMRRSGRAVVFWCTKGGAQAILS